MRTHDGFLAARQNGTVFVGKTALRNAAGMRGDIFAADNARRLENARASKNAYLRLRGKKIHNGEYGSSTYLCSGNDSVSSAVGDRCSH